MFTNHPLKKQFNSFNLLNFLVFYVSSLLKYSCSCSTLCAYNILKIKISVGFGLLFGVHILGTNIGNDASRTEKLRQYFEWVSSKAWKL